MTVATQVINQGNTTLFIIYLILLEWHSQMMGSRVILDRAKLDKGETITCLGNSCTSLLPVFRVREVSKEGKARRQDLAEASSNT